VLTQNIDVSFVVKQFREVVKDCQLPNSEDAYLARWVIGTVSIIRICYMFHNPISLYTARDFDIVKAEKMLRNVSENQV
jgi:hypothetical protein